MCHKVIVGNESLEGTVHMQVITIGIDLAKNVFHVHGVDANDKVVFNRPLRRSQVLPFFAELAPCLIGMEACASAHYWARELKKLGHSVRMMPAKDVMAYVKRGKNDAIDAAACCEAVRRPTVRTVPVKTPEQQAQLMQHRVRELLIGQRTQAINALRSHLAELGIVAAQGYEGLKVLLAIVADSSDTRLPEPARASLSALVAQIASCQAEIGAIDKRLLAQHRKCEDSKRLETIPSIGVIGATAIVATVPDASIFKRGRDFASWIGIVPREDSTGGKRRLGPISKQGDRYLRRLLIVGAFAVLRQARAHPEKYPWVTQLLARKPAKVVAVAIANKTARIAWAVLTKKENYRVQTNVA
jgi:transposase